MQVLADILKSSLIKPVTDAIVYIVMGVTAAGKTTIGTRLSEALEIPFIEGDRLHPEDNVAKMSAGIPLTDTDRWPWFACIAATLNEMEGSTVVSCSALKRVYRDCLRASVKHPVRFLWLHPERDELEARLEARENHFMPTTLLKSQLETLEPPQDEKDVINVTGLDMGEICAALDRLL